MLSHILLVDTLNVKHKTSNENPFKGLGNFDASDDYIRGRLHLRRKTRNGRTPNQSIENGRIGQTFINMGRQHIGVGTIKRNRRTKDAPHQNQMITIDSNHLISQYQRTRNCISAIAAVDYAMRDTKPTCGLVMGI